MSEINCLPGCVQVFNTDKNQYTEPKWEGTWHFQSLKNRFQSAMTDRPFVVNRNTSDSSWQWKTHNRDLSLRLTSSPRPSVLCWHKNRDVGEMGIRGKGQEGEEERLKEQTQSQIKISQQEGHVTTWRRKNSGKSQSYLVSQRPSLSSFFTL